MRACGAVILSACVRWCTLETKAASCRAVRAFTQTPFASSRGTLPVYAYWSALFCVLGKPWSKLEFRLNFLAELDA